MSGYFRTLATLPQKTSGCFLPPCWK